MTDRAAFDRVTFLTLLILAVFPFCRLSGQSIDLRIIAADSLFESGRYQAADSLYLDVLKDSKGAARAGAMKGLGNLAFVYGHYDQADKYYRDARVLFKQVREPRGEAKTTINQGNLSYLRGDYPAAQKLFEQAIGIIGRVKDPSPEDKKDLIAATGDLGQAVLARGDAGSAAAYFRNGLASARAINYSAGIADNLHNLGNLFQQTGEPDSALAEYREAAEIFLTMNHPKRAADVLREMGNIYRKIGEYDQAYDQMYKALGLLKMVKRGDYLPGEGELLNNLGLLYQDLGNYQNALENFQSALNAFRFLGDSTGIQKVLENTGNVFLRRAQGDSSDNDSARYYYDLARKVQNHPADEANYLNNLGVLSENRGDYQSAAEYYRQARDFYEAVKDSLGIARASNNLANRAMADNDYDRAVGYYRTALAVIQRYRRRDWEASLLANLGFALNQDHQPDEALKSLNQAAVIVEQLRQGISSQEFRSQYLENKIVIFEELVGLYVQKGFAREAFNAAERAKARAFLDLLAGSAGIGFREDLDPEVKALIGREEELARKIEYLAGDSGQTRAIMERDSLRQVLDVRFPDYRALKIVRPITVEQLQAQLDGRTAVVEYFLGGRAGYVFLITRDRLSVKKLDADPRRIYEMVDSLRKVIRTKSDFTRYGRELYAILLKPVRADLANSDRLCIIPHSVLHHLPFAALVENDSPRKLLVEDYDIFYAPSASVYALAHAKDRRRMTASAIFAKSNFAEHSEWFDMSLPGTNVEKDSILAARVLPGAVVYSDVDPSRPPPTETNAKRHAREYDLIHFATHGKLDSDSPLDSRIILSADSANDGELKVREIFNLKLNAYLVTLSACQTGQLKAFAGTGKYALGDELTGLSRAFIYAGAPSVVASLWKVSDAATVLLMVNFYKNLQTQDKARALCAAQRGLMKSEYYSAPFYWAPFVVIGDGD